MKITVLCINSFSIYFPQTSKAVYYYVKGEYYDAIYYEDDKRYLIKNNLNCDYNFYENKSTSFEFSNWFLTKKEYRRLKLKQIESTL